MRFSSVKFHITFHARAEPYFLSKQLYFGINNKDVTLVIIQDISRKQVPHLKFIICETPIR